MRHLALLLLATACAPPASTGPLPVWDAGGLGFFDTPWPNDQRVEADGTLNLTRFPNPSGSSLLTSYLAFGDRQVGFGTNSPIFIQLDGPVDPLLMPTPDESLFDANPSVMLVNIDLNSGGFGARYPIQWRMWDSQTNYLPPYLLAVAPVAGFPLRPGARHALIVTTQVAQQSPQFAALLDKNSPDREVYGDLDRALPLLGLRRRDVAVATVFTTTKPTEELGRISRFLDERVALPVLDQPLELLQSWSTHRAYRARYPSPVFTHGTRPYLLAGGGLQFRDDGQPEIHSWDDLRVAVCTPADLSSPPPGGWPVVIYQHGTGGYYRGGCDSAGRYEVGRVLAEQGMITLGIDQPLHGPREGQGTGGDLANFNILNPDSGVSNFRQGAIDAIYLARALARQPVTFTTPAGEPVPINSGRVLFLGHSQGGLTGAIAAPFIGPDVPAMVLSGAGGVLAITIVERKDPLDFAALVRGLVGLEPTEDVSALHPVLGLVQTLVEQTDPVNYAPYWYWRDGPDVNPPVHMLLTSGTNDSATPYSTSEALAAAGRLPPLAPRATTATALRLRGLTDQPSPQSLNASGRGDAVTAGFLQWRDGSHFIIFEHQPVVDTYVDFLRTAADDVPVLDYAGPYR